MKPLHLIALLLFVGGAVWALTRNDRAVREIQAAYYSAMSPFLTQGSKLETRARGFLTETRLAKDLEARLAATAPELERLKLFEAHCRKLEEENARLRKALGFQQGTRFEVVAASIVRRNPSTWWQTADIDAGAKRGVREQLAVVCDEGLVGKIDRVNRDGLRSSMLLLTDESCLVSARVEGSPEVGILSGQRGAPDGAPMLRLRFLSTDAAVRPGQRVLTTGRGGIFQADILLGEIQSVEKGARDSEALVRPSVNFADLGAVFVVLSPES